MNNSYKIIVAHPGQQHSYHSAIALKDDLFLYITTQYYKKGRSLTWLSSLFAKEQLKKRIMNRYCSQIDDKVKVLCETRSLIAKLGLQNKFPAIRKKIEYYDRFGNRVANICLKKNVDAVIMFDTTASACFQKIHEANSKVVKILDVTIGSRIYAKYLYEKEMQNIKSDCFYKEYPDLWNPQILNKFQNEIDFADYAIAASKYVKETLIYSGMPEDKIYIVPYGTTKRSINRSSKKKNDKLELLFVGQINYRKGIHRLLEVIQYFSESEVHLNIAGDFSDNNEIYMKYKDNPRVSFLGLVPHEQIGQLYEKCDVFVLPSLSEGMARVGLEALGCGLPVICTDHSGINDIIVDGENGFTVPVCNNDAIKDKIEWFLSHKKELTRMSQCAINTGQKYTWEVYYKKYYETIHTIIKDARAVDK